MEHCGRCGAEVAPGAEFCVQCGERARCGGCGAPWHHDAVFCGMCGWRASQPGQGLATSGGAPHGIAGAVIVLCPLCWTAGTVPSNATSWECPGCRRAIAFVRCSRCGGPAQAPKDQGAPCSWCANQARHSIVLQQPIDAGAYAGEYARRGIEIDPGDIERRWIYSCTLLGGAGTPLRDGSPCTMQFARDWVSVTDTISGQGVRVAYDDIRDIELGGPGAVQSGGGFIGGGFGVGGIVAGIAMAAALNKLTTRTSVQTLVRLAARHAELILSHDRATPDQLRIYLSPAFARIAAAHDHTTQPSARVDAVEQLQRLGEMKSSGFLNEQEFADAKAAILRGMGGA